MTTIAEFVAKASKKHVRSVARALGLDAGNDYKREIQRALTDERRLATLLDRLGDDARGLLAGVVFAGRPIEVSQYGFERRAPSRAMLELERHGLLYGFEAGWSHHYVLADDLHEPVRAVLATRAAGAVADATARSFIAAPLQTAHDAASLWAHLAREPARLKADGELYVRAAPKLAAALAPIEFGDADEARNARVAAALRLLRDDELLRVRVDDRPGGGGRRELVPAGDPTRTLGDDPVRLRNRLISRAQEAVEPDIAVALVRALAGRTVELASFAEAFCGLLAQSMGRLPRGVTAQELALVGVGPIWHAGGLELGRDADGGLVAVRCAPAEIDAPEGLLGLCQGNFEIVALRAPTPPERVELELIAERCSGQTHAFALTRASVATAVRAGHALGADGPVERLERLVGELPQNVARSIDGWARGARTVSLRSALFVDAGDAARADELAAGPLAGMVVARLGEGLLAIRADDLPAIERALAGAGLPLEPGLDRVSGRWIERDSANSGAAESAWQPCDREPPGLLGFRPRGRQVSTIGAQAAAPAGASSTLIANLATLIDEGKLVKLSLCDQGRYETAVVIPTQLDGGQLLGWCEDCQQEHAFSLQSIEQVALAA